jgi:hypothetical protein
MKTNKNLTIFIVVAVVLLVSTIIVFQLVAANSTSDKQKNPQLTTENNISVNEENGETAVAVYIGTREDKWQINRQNEIVVDFSQIPKSLPNAVTLQILYDPLVLRIDKAEPGDLWEGTNVLQESIDNGKGEALFSFGRGFDKQFTGNLNILNLKATLISAVSETGLLVKLGPESYYASTETNGLIPLTGEYVVDVE